VKAGLTTTFTASLAAVLRPIQTETWSANCDTASDPTLFVALIPFLRVTCNATRRATCGATRVRTCGATYSVTTPGIRRVTLRAGATEGRRISARTATSAT